MSVSKERQVNCYPHPVFLAQLKAYAKINEMSKSEALEQGIRCLIESLPPDQKLRVINAAKEIMKPPPSKNTY